MKKIDLEKYIVLSVENEKYRLYIMQKTQIYICGNMEAFM